MKISSNIVVKTARPQDIELLLPLLEQLFTIETDFTFNAAVQRQGLAMMLERSGSHCIVKTAWTDNRLVGMCTAQIRISTAEGSPVAVIEDMVIDRRYKNRGIGSALISAIETWAANTGISTLTLLADDGNLPALNFYKKNKFERTRLVCLRKKI